MSMQEHWERVWTTKDESETSWYQPEPGLSLELITRHGGDNPRVLDVGGGSSRVVDGLLELGVQRIGVLDVAGAAVAVSQQRLGARAEAVQWIVADVTRYEPGNRWDVWHDRAVFHFLTDRAQRHAYVRVAERALETGGHAVVATFGPEGPTRCSGLEVVRHSPASLQYAFGEPFDLVEAREEAHTTPGGATQQFIYAVLRKR